MGLRNSSPKIFFALLETLFSVIEKRTIEKMQKSSPAIMFTMAIRQRHGA